MSDERDDWDDELHAVFLAIYNGLRPTLLKALPNAGVISEEAARIAVSTSRQFRASGTQGSQASA